MVQHIGVTMVHLHIFYAVECGIMPGILHAPLVYIISDNTLCSILCGDNPQYSGATTTVDHTLVFQVLVEQGRDYQPRCLVCSGPKGQSCVDENMLSLAGCGGNRLLGIANQESSLNVDRFEALCLPFLVPVFIIGISHCISDVNARYNEMFDSLLHHVFIPILRLGECFESVFSVFKRFTTGLSGCICQQSACVISSFWVAFQLEINLEILHNVV